jgi:hypothetical protein
MVSTIDFPIVLGFAFREERQGKLPEGSSAAWMFAQQFRLDLLPGDSTMRISTMCLESAIEFSRLFRCQRGFITFIGQAFPQCVDKLNAFSEWKTFGDFNQTGAHAKEV